MGLRRAATLTGRTLPAASWLRLAARAQGASWFCVGASRCSAARSGVNPFRSRRHAFTPNGTPLHPIPRLHYRHSDPSHRGAAVQAELCCAFDHGYQIPASSLVRARGEQLLYYEGGYYSHERRLEMGDWPHGTAVASWVEGRVAGVRPRHGARCGSIVTKRLEGTVR